MRFVKIFTVMPLILASMQAIAFTPPYHINGPAILGVATFKSSGTCKIALQKIAAQFGDVVDSTDASVGQGVISVSGELLAIRNTLYLSPVMALADNSATQIGFTRRAIIYVGDDMATYIKAQSNCSGVQSILPIPPAAYLEIKKMGPTKVQYLIKQPFSGVSDIIPLRLCLL